MTYCRCEQPVMDPEFDAGCRRCGLPVDFNPLPPLFTRVRLRHDVDRYPHFIAPAGATGTVVAVGVNGDCFRVRMDQTIAGAEDWDNEVLWSPRDGDRPNDDLEVM